MIQQRHRRRGEVGDAVREVLGVADVERDDAEAARERGHLLEEAPAPEAEAVDHEQRRAAVPMNVVVHADLFVHHEGHRSPTSLSVPKERRSCKPSVKLPRPNRKASPLWRLAQAPWAELCSRFRALYRYGRS